jgi:hypothetical protein
MKAWHGKECVDEDMKLAWDGKMELFTLPAQLSAKRAERRK